MLFPNPQTGTYSPSVRSSFFLFHGRPDSSLQSLKPMTSRHQLHNLTIKETRAWLDWAGIDRMGVVGEERLIERFAPYFVLGTEGEVVSDGEAWSEEKQEAERKDESWPDEEL